MLQEAINDPRTFERFLREQGFSRNRAKAITAKGFRSVHGLVPEPSEVSGLVKTLYGRKIALDAVTQHKCNDNCSDCVPCRKQFGASDRCQALANDINDGNKSRWKAWRNLDKAVTAFKAATNVFIRQQENALRDRSLQALGNIVVAVGTRSPGDVASAGLSVASLIEKVSNYNGVYAREYKTFIQRYVVSIEGHKSRAIYLDKIFWQQVKAHEREGCSRLPASAYNRP